MMWCLPFPTKPSFPAHQRFKSSQSLVGKYPTTDVDAETLIQQRWQGKRILVADDEPINREIIKMLLEDRGLLVDAAEDSSEAVTLAQDNDLTPELRSS